RVSVTRGAGWTVTANSVSPAATVAFAQCTAGAATAYYWMTGTASTGTGKQLHRGPLGSNLGPFTAVAGTDTITIPGLTGVAINDPIGFFAAIGSTLPTGITEGTIYFVKTVATNDITISTTPGGATLDITAAGDGTAFKFTPINISTGVTPQLTTATSIQED
ncbi:MAG: hypothetical protein ACRCZI_03160, partial [Cetobacterium sp.]